jgi:hypothetical protein
VQVEGSDSSQSAIAYPATGSELLNAVTKQHRPAFIVDHTIPWGDKSSRIPAIMETLPETRARFCHINSSLPFLLVVLTLAKNADALVAVVPRGFLVELLIARHPPRNSTFCIDLYFSSTKPKR